MKNSVSVVHVKLLTWGRIQIFLAKTFEDDYSVSAYIPQTNIILLARGVD